MSTDIIDSDGTGLITTPNQGLTTPAGAAEQQRVVGEIQAALTVARSFPRDQKRCLENILISCERIGVAEEAQYSYSRGGTAISGASIKLMELTAQLWGNIRWGFRELARFEGVPGRAGYSVVEAYAWDLESNSGANRQFTVEHAMTAYGKLKILTDPRDIYEYIANQAQRRVRTCLENVIPRDIVDSACEQCEKTLKEKVPVTPESVKKMLEAFAKFKVTKEHIETRLQRNLDSMTSANYAGLRKIYKSLDEGMSEPSEWFKDWAPATGASAKPAKTATETAKDAMRAKKAPPQSSTAGSTQAVQPAAGNESDSSSVSPETNAAGPDSEEGAEPAGQQAETPSSAGPVDQQTPPSSPADAPVCTMSESHQLNYQTELADATSTAKVWEAFDTYVATTEGGKSVDWLKWLAEKRAKELGGGKHGQPVN